MTKGKIKQCKLTFGSWKGFILYLFTDGQREPGGTGRKSDRWQPREQPRFQYDGGGPRDEVDDFHQKTILLYFFLLAIFNGNSRNTGEEWRVGRGSTDARAERQKRKGMKGRNLKGIRVIEFSWETSTLKKCQIRKYEIIFNPVWNLLSGESLISWNEMVSVNSSEIHAGVPTTPQNPRLSHLSAPFNPSYFVLFALAQTSKAKPVEAPQTQRIKKFLLSSEYEKPQLETSWV